MMLKPYILTREYKVDDGEWDILNTCTVLLEEDGSDFHPRFQEETTLTFDEVWSSANTFVGIYTPRTLDEILEANGMAGGESDG